MGKRRWRERPETWKPSTKQKRLTHTESVLMMFFRLVVSAASSSRLASLICACPSTGAETWFVTTCRPHFLHLFVACTRLPAAQRMWQHCAGRILRDPCSGVAHARPRAAHSRPLRKHGRRVENQAAVRLSFLRRGESRDDDKVPHTLFALDGGLWRSSRWAEIGEMPWPCGMHSLSCVFRCLDYPRLQG